MSEFYTVDRWNSLAEDQVLDADFDLTVWPPHAVEGYYSADDLGALARGLFGEGISPWGKYMLFGSYDNEHGIPTGPAIEIVVELARRDSFPYDLPSRFSSRFGCRELEEARRWKRYFIDRDYPDSRIFRVSCKKHFEGDANLLNIGNSLAEAWMYATKYWSGVDGPNPNRECLLVPPVRVLQLVE